ncbi:MAG: alpha/beta fold hydrolase [Myxococcales bacterium]|nr:alpha/beta fold hydrolase [Myxococcales bacterium]MDP3500006.1 alpha/beta fold hydrolase [Myxococcales bacterium]
MSHRLFRQLVLVSALSSCSAVIPVAGTDAGSVVDAIDDVDAGADAGVVVDAGVVPDAGVDAGTSGPDAGAADAGVDPLVAMRPFDVTVPVGYRPDQPVPLVVVLHGYTATAQTQDLYFGLSRLAQSRTFLVALPNGLRDDTLQQYWNATDACCAFGKTNDDVAYLTAVIRDVQRRFAVDPRRIFLVGHSNGGFMSHRLACDRSNLIAGIVALAGNTWADASKCNPTDPVAVLQIHGTLDPVIAYNGGATVGQPPYPSAQDSVRSWGAKNRCTGAGLTSIGGDLDLVTALLGDETKREGFSGCPANAAAELWTIRGAGHLPLISAAFSERLYTWLLAHPKP